MRNARFLTGAALLLSAAGAMAADAWHHPLYLDGGGVWRQRVRVDIRNDMDREAAGEAVAVRIGRGAGEADLVGAAAQAVRVCDANGVEMLYALGSPGGKPVTRGPIPAGSVLTIPAECRAKSTARCYVYFNNPAAWRVPDFLPAAAGARKGGLTPSRITAALAKGEQLRLAEVGGSAPWYGGKADGPLADCRRPVRLINFSDRPAARILISVDPSVLFAGIRGAEGPVSVLLTDGAKVLPQFYLEEALLFEVSVPARTVRTFHAHFRKGSQADRPEALGYADLLAGPHNLVKNASFEDGEKLPAAWAGSAEGSRPAGATMGLDSPGLLGRRCGKVNVPHGQKKAWVGWRQDVPVHPGRTYLYGAWVKCRDVRGGTVQLHAHYRDAAGQLCREKQYAGAGSGLTGTANWTFMSGTFTMPRDIATFQLHLTMNATGTVWHDAVALVEVAPATVGSVERRSTDADDLAVWPVNAIVKVFQEDAASAKPAPARIAAARGEAEPLQLAIRSGRAVKQVTVEIDPPASANGRKLTDVTVGLVGYVPIDHKTSYYRSTSPAWHRKFPTGSGRCDGWAGMWPDPILPRKTFDLAIGKTQPVWITVTVPKDAPAGDYEGAVRLTHNGKLLKKAPFTVHVWDFALPDQTHLAAVYDVRTHSPLWRRPGETQDAARRRMWRFMAERRLCPDRVSPEPVLRYKDGKVQADFTKYDEAAAHYFDALKLPHTYTPRCFYLFGWGHPPGVKFGQRPYEGDPPYDGADRSKLRPAFKRAYQACLKAYWEHMKARGWHRKVLLYISDEPHDRHEHIREQMKALCDMIHEVDPQIPIYSSTWHHQPAWDASLDVWGIGHYGVVPTTKMAELRAAGKRLWFTTDGHMCTDTPYCAVERLLPHYCFQYGAEAYEFWGVDWLTYNPYEFGWHRYIHQSDTPGQSYYVRYPNGDGYLAYPGAPVGSDGPVPSIRLEQAREGVEDYEYLYLLRDLVAKAKAGGRDASAGEAALRAAAKLVAIPNAGGRYSTGILADPDAVFRVREQVARAIEKLRR